MPGKANRDSKYKRIQRFIGDFDLDLSMIAMFIANLVLKELESWTLTIDRTNWKFGRANINILTLGVAYYGSAIPLLWIPLTKRGNSNTSERISIMQPFINIFSICKIECLTADREFIGNVWFQYLFDNGTPFRIRITENIRVANSQGILVPAKNLFRMLKTGEHKILSGKRDVGGVKLFIIGMLLPDGEYLIIVTDSNPETALQDYKQRWEIETLFGCLKTRGFEFESTHITESYRIQRLVALMAIAYTWCIFTGQWLNKIQEIKIKKHDRKEISLFRHGLNKLREILFNINEKYQAFKKNAIRFFDLLIPNYRFINRFNSEISIFCPVLRRNIPSEVFISRDDGMKKRLCDKL